MFKAPLAVIISDIHYNINTRMIADTSVRMAVDKAYELQIPMIVAGDLHDSKAVIRAECANTIIKTMEYANDKGVEVYCLVGNHDLVNEKGSEHALNFLKPYCNIIQSPVYIGRATEIGLIPYQTSVAKFLEALNTFPKGTTVIGHQGTKDGAMGDYIQDHSAFDSKLAEGYKVYLGHYHKHYTLGSTVSIGNPYTLSFGEANDPEKGFLVVYTDGSFERILTKLRRHVVWETTLEEITGRYHNVLATPGPDDLVWLKLHGSRSQLDGLSKASLGEELFGHANFKLDKIYTGSEEFTPKVRPPSPQEAFDLVIDQTPENEQQKKYLKQLYLELLK